jgi:hypothetical protein
VDGASVEVERAEDGGRPHPARHQADVGDTGPQRRLERRLLAASVRGHHHGGRVVARTDLGTGLDGEAERCA